MKSSNSAEIQPFDQQQTLSVNAICKKIILSRVFLQYVLAAFASLFILFLTTGLWKANLHIPFTYYGDGIMAQTFVKTVMDTGWNNTNPYLGLPAEYNLASFPMAEGFHYLLIKIIAFFTTNSALVMNIFFILSFPLAALTALFVMQRIGLSYLFALPASILFAMAPHHFLRFEDHLFLSSYYTIPLATWLAILVAENKIFVDKFAGREIACCLICILIGSSGIYYAYFGVFFIVIAGLISGFKYKKIKCVYPAGILAALIVLTGLINLSPAIIYKLEHPNQSSISGRLPLESEAYGLKIMGMLMPSEGDKIHLLRKLGHKYHSTSPLPSGEISRLGSLAGMGFLLLILFLLLDGDSLLNDKIRILSKLNIFGTLLGTLGGLGSLVAYTLSPMIRCYYRICIFIMFFSLAAIFYVIQQIIKKYPHLNNRYIIGSLMIAVLSFGLLTQMYDPHLISKRMPVTISSGFYSDREFIQRIELILPENSMVFQLPYLSYPENGPVNGVDSYDHLKAYLHSHYLRWSFGAMRGNEADQWQQKVSSLPTLQFLNQLVYTGFEGIYIDRHGYKDNGKSLEAHLTKALLSSPIQSQNNRLIFYDLRDYAAKLEKMESVQAWQRHVAQAKTLNLEQSPK